VLFCPFDGKLNYPLSMDITTTLTTWPLLFNPQFTYAISSAKGVLLVAQSDPGIITQAIYECKLGGTNTVYPNSLGS
jgi:hypothetical protein